MLYDPQRFRETSDEQLAREAQSGSLEAFDELARRLQRLLVRFLARRFPYRRDAEDLTQETLLKAFQSLGQYQLGRPVRTWVFTIAYRLAVSRGRTENPAAQSVSATLSASAQQNPARLVETRDTRQRLWATAREVLSEPQFTALWLFYVEQMPAGEVAQVMGRSWVSVKTLLFRARQRLQPLLSDEAAFTKLPADVRLGELP
jgi:RNA polymerase sigma-70 factor, ECF subfamily